MTSSASPAVFLCRALFVAGVLVACSSEAPQEPPPSTGTAGTGGQSDAGAGGAGTGGTASAGSDAGGSGGGNTAGAGGTGPSCFDPGPGVCCPTEKCYTAQELTELGCSAVDLHTEGCPHPVELPIGNCHWYEATTTTEDGKCCYTFYSGNCCGP